MPHDGQEVHAQVPHVHAPLPQGLGGVCVHKHPWQPPRCPLLVQGSDSPVDLRHRLEREEQTAGWVTLIPQKWSQRNEEPWTRVRRKFPD